jgi:glycosyltransferase involved in cell wall biosynthesis
VNIAYVVHHYDASEGTGGYVTQLLPRLAQAHEVTLYAATVRTPPPDGVRVIHVPALRGRAYATILTFPAAFAAVRKSHDIIHAQGWVAPSANVVTAHIVLAAWRDAARRADVRTPPGERVFGSFVVRREASLVRRADVVIAPSQQARDDLARWYGREGGVAVIPHGFAAPLLNPKRNRTAFGVRDDAFVALYVGDARKGLARALRSVAQCPAAVLMVASHSAPAPYAALARDLGLGNRFRWIGPQSDMEAVYAASDVLIHPTIYDTFGLVVAEAMAAGVPPIVSSEAGISELLTHMESAWIATDENATAMALNQLADDKQLRASLGQGAQAVAQARSWDVVARETENIYQQVVGQ